MVWFPRAYDFLGCCFLPYYCLRFRVQMRAMGEMLSDPFCITTVLFIITQPKSLIIIFPLRASFLLLNDLHSIPTSHFPHHAPPSLLSHGFLSFFPHISHMHSLKHPLPIPTPPSNLAFLSLPSFLPSFLPLPSSYMYPIRPTAHPVICIIPTPSPSLA